MTSHSDANTPARAMELSITIPHPPRACWPNSGHGRHWTASFGAKKLQRQNAHLLMLTSMSEAGAGEATPPPTSYRIRYYYKGHPHDEDNILAACKSALDGCADALGINDRRFHCAGIERIHALHDPRCGTITITFTDNQPTNTTENKDTMTPPLPKAPRSMFAPSYAYAALAWGRKGETLYIDAALATTQKDAGNNSDLLHTRAIARGASDVKTMTLSTVDLKILIESPGIRPYPEDSEEWHSKEFRTALGQLRPWLNVAGKNKGENLHFGVWNDKRKAPLA